MRKGVRRAVRRIVVVGEDLDLVATAVPIHEASGVPGPEDSVRVPAHDEFPSALTHVLAIRVDIWAGD